MKENRQDGKRDVIFGAQAGWVRGGGAVLLLVSIALAGYLMFHLWRSPAPDTAPRQPQALRPPAAAEPAAMPVAAEPAAAPKAATASAAAGSASFEMLKGRWERPDGGYVLEVKHVEPRGTATVAYFNPSPIRVARAQAQRDGGAVKLFLELRDQGYPGCTYSLTYHPDRDELEGVYFQAAMGAYYEVVFVRLK